METLKATVIALKESLHMSDNAIKKLENETRDKRLSSSWFSARQYRLMASQLGQILHCKSETPPDSLVLRILQPKQFSLAATN